MPSFVRWSGLACGLTLAACSPPAERPAQSAPVAAPPSRPSQAPAPNPLGSGSALTGQVSPLTGAVQAFRVQETATTTIVELAADVLFAFDSADLAPGATEQLRRTADLIARGGPGAVTVIGHTDSRGDETYNRDLSLRRANTVVAWFSTQADIPASRLQAAGRGEADPVAPNETSTGADDPDGRALNRRVTVTIPKP